MDEKITDLDVLANIESDATVLYAVDNSLDYQVTVLSLKNYVLGSKGLVDSISWSGANWTSTADGVTAANLQEVLTGIGLTGSVPTYFADIVSGQTPFFELRGWKAGDSLRTTRFGISGLVDDTFDFSQCTNYRFMGKQLQVYSDNYGILRIEADVNDDPAHEEYTARLDLIQDGGGTTGVIGLNGVENEQPDGTSIPNASNGTVPPNSMILGLNSWNALVFMVDGKKKGIIEKTGKWRFGALSDLSSNAYEGEYHTMYSRDEKALRFVGPNINGSGFRTMFGDGYNCWLGEPVDDEFWLYGHDSVRQMSTQFLWGSDSNFGSGTFTEWMQLTTSGLQLFGTGATVNAIETTLTNSADKIPNSAAIYSLVGFLIGTFVVGDLSTDGTDFWLDLNHAKNQKLVNLIISDDSDLKIEPDQIVYTDANNLRVYLTAYQATLTGTWSYSVG